MFMQRTTKVLAGLIPVPYADIRRSWSPTVHGSGASPTGYGICQAEVDRDEVGCVGRWQERWRFKRLSPSCALPKKSRLYETLQLADVSTVPGNSPTRSLVVAINAISTCRKRSRFPQLIRRPSLLCSLLCAQVPKGTHRTHYRNGPLGL